VVRPASIYVTAVIAEGSADLSKMTQRH